MDDVDDADDSLPAAGRGVGVVQTDADRAEEYDEDFAGILCSVDPKRKALQLWSEEASGLDIFDFWIGRWNTLMWSLAAQVLSIVSAGDLKKLQHRFLTVRDRNLHRLWKEHLRLSGSTDRHET